MPLRSLSESKMENNFDLIEQNEAGKNANGGTELFMRFLYGGRIPRELLVNTQIIPGRIRELDSSKIRVLTLHDLPEDPECQKLKDAHFRKKFHKIVFISNWQYQRFRDILRVPYSTEHTVIENGLEPIDVDIDKKPDVDDVVNICYITTPHRGLELLVPMFEMLAKEDKKIHLHVHSSFNMYGWPDADKPYEKLFDTCKSHPQITYHGYTEFNQLRGMMKDYHICAYPSIWEETACRSILEAMSAGMLCVHPNFGALFDTTGGMNFMYDGSADKRQHADMFGEHLYSAIMAVRTKSDAVRSRLLFNKSYVDTRYHPDLAISRWNRMLGDLNDKYDTPEKRKLETQMFSYKVG